MKRAAVLSDTALYPQAAISSPLPPQNRKYSQRCASHITCAQRCALDGATHVNMNHVYRIQGTEHIITYNLLSCYAMTKEELKYSAPHLQLAFFAQLLY